jgi:enoyl-[acyl-carrier-protein] reductase (NADH)
VQGGHPAPDRAGDRGLDHHLELDRVSHAVVYLASEESRYVTGLELKIDAGYSIR